MKRVAQYSTHPQSHVQVHVSIIGLDPAEQLVVVAQIDQDLGVSRNGLIEYGKGSRLEVRGMFGGLFFGHDPAQGSRRRLERGWRPFMVGAVGGGDQQYQ